MPNTLLHRRLKEIVDKTDPGLDTVATKLDDLRVESGRSLVAIGQGITQALGQNKASLDAIAAAVNQASQVSMRQGRLAVLLLKTLYDAWKLTHGRGPKPFNDCVTQCRGDHNYSLLAQFVTDSGLSRNDFDRCLADAQDLQEMQGRADVIAHFAFQASLAILVRP